MKKKYLLHPILSQPKHSRRTRKPKPFVPQPWVVEGTRVGWLNPKHDVREYIYGYMDFWFKEMDDILHRTPLITSTFRDTLTTGIWWAMEPVAQSAGHLTETTDY